MKVRNHEKIHPKPCGFNDKLLIILKFGCIVFVSIIANFSLALQRLLRLHPAAVKTSRVVTALTPPTGSAPHGRLRPPVSRIVSRWLSKQFRPCGVNRRRAGFPTGRTLPYPWDHGVASYDTQPAPQPVPARRSKQVHQLIAPHAWRLAFERAWRDTKRGAG